MYEQPSEDDARLNALLAAQAQAEALFAEIVALGLVRPGVSERDLSAEIHGLAAAQFGVEAHWHRQVVRAGPNTVLTFPDTPADRRLLDDDICFIDLGPVFGSWEADFGRTVVLGDDPRKARLTADLPLVFEELRANLSGDPELTGSSLYACAVEAAARRGWRFGGDIAGHTVGEFPDAGQRSDRRHDFIAPGNDRPLSAPDADGRRRNWIIEVHLVEPGGLYGGFYEQLAA